jgi:hypothetical protein
VCSSDLIKLDEILSLRRNLHHLSSMAPVGLFEFTPVYNIEEKIP